MSHVSKGAVLALVEHTFSLFDLNDLLLFQLSRGSTFGRCVHLVLANLHSCLL